jgi:diguanylate cyclase (GGDEF)-like protein/PAS domain S-box-containing protein
MLQRNGKRGAAVSPELQDWVANRVVTAHIRNIPAITMGSLLNLAVVTIALWHAVDLAVLMVIDAVLFVLIGGRLWLARGISRSRRRAQIARMAAAFRVNSALMGLVTGTGCILFMPIVGPGNRMLMGLAVATQLAATGYTVRTLPGAARAFMIPAAAGLCIGLARIGGLPAYSAVVLMAAYTGLMLHMVEVAHALFVTRVLRERELNSANHTVKLLLNEFEESGSDWLFELDNENRMVSVGRRFAQAAGRSLAEMEGAPFVRLFAAGGGREQLAERLSGRHAFRHLELALRAGDSSEIRWWSVSGRPVYATPGSGVAFRGVISDVTGQKLAERRARRMAYYDSLTGMPNRALFESASRRMIGALGHDGRLALLLVDLDKFKLINDVHGHPVGDSLLREVAEAMRTAIDRSRLGGEGHFVARLSGDEFAVMIAGQDACDHSVRLAEEFLAELSSTFVIGECTIDITASIGIALCPDHADMPQQLLVDAGIALDAAKQSGRNRWEMFEPGMDRKLHEKHLLSRDLRHAVTQDELRLFLQPLVDLPSGLTSGYEVLLRWQHPVRGMIPPGEFIRIAEETGQIVAIGEWVIREALAEAARWSGQETVSINLSPVQLGSANLLPTIIRALGETGIDPSRVEFEITESVLLENSASNLQVLQRLRALGLKIALDDFGTGYASLNYLLTFPFDKIKIDRSFVGDLAAREDSQAIVQAVIGLAHRLGMVTLAEGVENSAQLTALRSMGCQMVQGWLFGEAVPVADYEPRKRMANVVPIKARSAAARTRRTRHGRLVG